MKDKKVFDEVNEKIGRIQQQFSIKMDWNDNKTHPKGEIVTVSTDSWQNADHIAEGAKFKAIEEITSTVPSNSVVLYAPKGAIIDLHSHPQMEFCICLSGELKIMTIENDYKTLKPIESIYIKPNELHLVEFIEESQIIVTWFPKLTLLDNGK